MAEVQGFVGGAERTCCPMAEVLWGLWAGLKGGTVKWQMRLVLYGQGCRGRHPMAGVLCGLWVGLKGGAAQWEWCLGVSGRG